MSNKKSRNKSLYQKAKKTKGRIKVLRALPYEGCNVYIRLIGINKGISLFEYLVSIKGEIYSSFIEITHKKKLTDNEIAHGVVLVLAGAYTTVEKVLGIKPKGKGKVTEKVAKAFIKSYEKN